MDVISSYMNRKEMPASILTCIMDRFQNMGAVLQLECEFRFGHELSGLTAKSGVIGDGRSASVPMAPRYGPCLSTVQMGAVGSEGQQDCNCLAQRFRASARRATRVTHCSDIPLQP